MPILKPASASTPFVTRPAQLTRRLMALTVDSGFDGHQFRMVIQIPGEGRYMASEQVLPGDYLATERVIDKLCHHITKALPGSLPGW